MQMSTPPYERICKSSSSQQKTLFFVCFFFTGDTRRLKQLTFCNFDFLLASVRTISISYLRSIIEHARCYLLDRDLELIYYTIRKSSDVLTRDTLQLGAQIICWLRPVSG